MSGIHYRKPSGELVSIINPSDDEWSEGLRCIHLSMMKDDPKYAAAVNGMAKDFAATSVFKDFIVGV